jgi:hypothetical protein
MLPNGAWRAVRNRLSRGFRAAVEATGFMVARKDDYYSPLTSEFVLRKTRRRWDRPSSLKGISYDLPKMKQHLAELVATYGQEFASLPSHDVLCKSGYGPGYPEVDALTLYAMIRRLKPARYMEVGSGLSTFYCSLAAKRNLQENRPTRIQCIEPFPYPKLKEIENIELTVSEVQDVPVSEFQRLSEGDVLFIDSSHTVRIDGDVPYLILEVVPALAPGVYVHVHDIPFPYNSPHPAALWPLLADPTAYHWPVFWTEAMLLQAFLAFNSRFEIVLSARFSAISRRSSCVKHCRCSRSPNKRIPSAPFGLGERLSAPGCCSPLLGWHGGARLRNARTIKRFDRKPILLPYGQCADLKGRALIGKNLVGLIKLVGQDPHRML